MCVKTVDSSVYDYLLSNLPKAQQDKAYDEINWYAGYAELGCDDAPNGVCVANWNNFEALGNDLERSGVQTEWSDEWTPCAACDKIVREEPDGFDWAPFLLIDGNEIVCLKCFREEHCERVQNGWIVTRNYGCGREERQYVVAGDDTKDQYGKDALDHYLQTQATIEYRLAKRSFGC